MKYKILGNTGLKVSNLCLGTMNYGGKGFFGYMENLDQNAVDEQIKTVTDAGVNFIHTTIIYSKGLSEVMIEKFIIDCKNLLNENRKLYLSFVEGEKDKSGYQKGSTGNRTCFYYPNLENLTNQLKLNNFEKQDLIRKT